MNRCDECGEILEKTFLMTEFNLPVSCWVCPRGEIYHFYLEKFREKYQRVGNNKGCDDNTDDARAKDFLSCLGNGKSIFQIEGEEE